MSLVLAHQGGWDEILLVLTPIALFAGLLWLANSRANKQLQRRRAAAEAPDDPVDPPPNEPVAGRRNRDDGPGQPGGSPEG